MNMPAKVSVRVGANMLGLIRSVRTGTILVIVGGSKVKMVSGEK